MPSPVRMQGALMLSVLELGLSSSLILSGTVTQLGYSTIPLFPSSAVIRTAQSRPPDRSDQYLSGANSPTQEPRRLLMPRYRVTISHRDREAMLDLVRTLRIQIDEHSARSTESGHSVDAIVEPQEIQRLEQAGYHVQRHEDVDEIGKERQKEVGRGDRYKQPNPR